MPQLQRLGRLATKVYDIEHMGIMHKRIKLYNTNIVEFNDQFIKLDSGGHRTQMTKNRMNQAANQFNLGFYVYQHRGTWRVRHGLIGIAAILAFNDGMIIQRIAQ